MIGGAATASPSLFLHEWASVHAELVWLYDQPVKPRHRTWAESRRDEKGYRAWFVRRGSVALTFGKRRVTVGAGRWVMPSFGQEAVFSRNAHILSLRFFCHWPSGEGVLRGVEGIVFDGGGHPGLERMAVELHGCLKARFPDLAGDEYVYSRQSSRYDDFLVMQGFFHAWLAGWYRASVEHGARAARVADGDPRPSRAARMLNTALLSRRFPAEDLRRETGLGLTRLNQLFFAESGLTLRKYWDRRRLEFARRCLATSRMPIKEIAFTLGFRSDSHFVVWFRRQAGARPGEYRARSSGGLAGRGEDGGSTAKAARRRPDERGF